LDPVIGAPGSAQLSAARIVDLVGRAAALVRLVQGLDTPRRRAVHARRDDDVDEDALFNVPVVMKVASRIGRGEYGQLAGTTTERASLSCQPCFSPSHSIQK
jgi:hypothetical protein